MQPLNSCSLINPTLKHYADQVQVRTLCDPNTEHCGVSEFQLTEMPIHWGYII